MYRSHVLGLQWKDAVVDPASIITYGVIVQWRRLSRSVQHDLLRNWCCWSENDHYQKSPGWRRRLFGSVRHDPFQISSMLTWCSKTAVDHLPCPFLSSTLASFPTATWKSVYLMSSYIAFSYYFILLFWFSIDLLLLYLGTSLWHPVPNVPFTNLSSTSMFFVTITLDPSSNLNVR